MFEQYVGDGANLFVIIVAVIMGFMAALTVIDVKGSNPDDKTDEEHH